MACYQPSNDDAFDDEGEDDIVVQKDWNRAENDVRKTGYRLGFSAGQEEMLQTGFDAGYKKAAVAAFAVSQLQGQISGVLSLLETTQPTDASTATTSGAFSSLTHSLTQLLEDCTQLQQSLPQRLQAQNQPWPQAGNACSNPHSHTGAIFAGPTHIPTGQPTTAACSQQSAAGDSDSLREVTELLSGTALQEEPLVQDPQLGQCLANLQQRYHSLLTSCEMQKWNN